MEVNEAFCNICPSQINFEIIAGCTAGLTIKERIRIDRCFCNVFTRQISVNPCHPAPGGYPDFTEG